MNKAWDDQPPERTRAEGLCSLHMNGRAVEVWRLEEKWYVTTGNLFGSQTVRCASVEHVFLVLGIVSGFNGTLRELPPGVTEVPNPPAKEESVGGNDGV